MNITNNEKNDVDLISDFMSDEERTYYTKKLKEAEKHNLIHTNTWTSDEFYARKREKYEI